MVMLVASGTAVEIEETEDVRCQFLNTSAYLG